MHVFNPEIAWHNRDPVYSVDVQGKPEVDADGQTWHRVATAGSDLHVLIWKVSASNDATRRPSLDVLADLNRHERSINVVRFAPVAAGDLLATADDCGNIIVWHRDPNKTSPVATPVNTPSVKRSGENSVEVVCMPKPIDDEPMDVDQVDGLLVRQHSPSAPGEKSATPDRPELFGDENIVDVEAWSGQPKVLRGHLEDVNDVCWSADGKFLISGSIDNSAIIWDVVKGCKLVILGDHRSWVQGVCWDPQGEFLLTMSSDRSLRIFTKETMKLKRRLERTETMFDGKLMKTRLFFDYTLPSFSRRMAFSPGGEFLLVPAGIVELEMTEKEKQDRAERAARVERDKRIRAAAKEKAQKEKELEKAQEKTASPSSVAEPIVVDENSASSNASEVSATSAASSEASAKSEANDSNKENKPEEKKAVDIVPVETTMKSINCCHLFLRNDLTKPAASFETSKYSVAVRCCPTLFTLREGAENPFPFPYRVVFAVACENAVLFFDTQQSWPFAYVTDIHYTRLSDIAWSPDGRLLMISSTDGYCTFVTFAHGELGEPYTGEIYKYPEPVVEAPPEKVPEVEKPAPVPVVDKTPAVIKQTPKIGSFYSKVDKSEIRYDTTPTTPKKRITPIMLTSSARRLYTSPGGTTTNTEAEKAEQVDQVDQVDNDLPLGQPLPPLTTAETIVDRTPEAVRNTPKIASMFAKVNKKDMLENIMPKPAARRIVPTLVAVPARKIEPVVNDDSNSDIQIIAVTVPRDQTNGAHDAKQAEGGDALQDEPSKAVEQTPKINTFFTSNSNGQQKRRITPIALSQPSKACKISNAPNATTDKNDNENDK